MYSLLRSRSPFPLCASHTFIDVCSFDSDLSFLPHLLPLLSAGMEEQASKIMDRMKEQNKRVGEIQGTLQALQHAASRK